MGDEEYCVHSFYFGSCESLGESGNFVSVASVPIFGGSWIVDDFAEGLHCSSNGVEDTVGDGKAFFDCWRSG